MIFSIEYHANDKFARRTIVVTPTHVEMRSALRDVLRTDKIVLHDDGEFRYSLRVSKTVWRFWFNWLMHSPKFRAELRNMLDAYE